MIIKNKHCAVGQRRPRVTRYPDIEPYENAMLDVGDGKQLYWESFGNLAGKPAFVLHFFFQAEDGIRDPLVTGVQTCALPISPHPIRGGRRQAMEASGQSGGGG